MPLGSLFAASVCGTGVYGRDNEDSWPSRPCHQLLCLLHDCVARASRPCHGESSSHVALADFRERDHRPLSIAPGQWAIASQRAKGGWVSWSCCKRSAIIRLADRFGERG